MPNMRPKYGATFPIIHMNFQSAPYHEYGHMQASLRGSSKLSANADFPLLKVMAACTFETSIFFSYCSRRY